MLDGRKLYNRAMKVIMDSSDHSKPLPLGLESIGPGLGPRGQPLKGIHAALAVKPIKDALQQMGKLNPNDNQSTYNADVVSIVQNSPTAFNQPHTLVGRQFAHQGGNAPFINPQTAPGQNMQTNPNVCNTNPNKILAQFGLINMGQVLANMQNLGHNMPNIGEDTSNFNLGNTNFVTHPCVSNNMTSPLESATKGQNQPSGIYYNSQEHGKSIKIKVFEINCL